MEGLTAGLITSIAGNILQGVGNLAQALVISRNKASKAAIEALREENESLRRQIADGRSEQRSIRMRAADRERRLYDEWRHERFKVLKYLDKQAGEQGSQMAVQVSSIMVASAQLVTERYLTSIDDFVRYAEHVVADALELPPDALRKVFSSTENIETALHAHGPLMETLIAAKSIRNSCRDGLQTCAAMTQLYYYICIAGMEDFRKPIVDAVNEFLAQHPLPTSGPQSKYLSMADVEEYLESMRQRLAEENASERRPK